MAAMCVSPFSTTHDVSTGGLSRPAYKALHRQLSSPVFQYLCSLFQTPSVSDCRFTALRNPFILVASTSLDFFQL
jgi:hypothetical protein